MRPDGAVSLSLNEVETLAAKAARGAGAGWGVAEDVSRAARWLAERGLPWSEQLMALLAAGGVAIALGPIFHAADFLAGAEDGDGRTVEPCDLTWAAPILAASLAGRAFGLTLQSDAGLLHLRADGGAGADRPWMDFFGPHRRSTIGVKIGTANPAPSFEIERTARRGFISPAIWHDLDQYAARTYVPASALSRAKGAGGVDDA